MQFILYTGKYQTCRHHKSTWRWGEIYEFLTIFHFRHVTIGYNEVFFITIISSTQTNSQLKQTNYNSSIEPNTTMKIQSNITQNILFRHDRQRKQWAYLLCKCLCANEENDLYEFKNKALKVDVWWRLCEWLYANREMTFVNEGTSLCLCKWGTPIWRMRPKQVYKKIWGKTTRRGKIDFRSPNHFH